MRWFSVRGPEPRRDRGSLRTLASVRSVDHRSLRSGPLPDRAQTGPALTRLISVSPNDRPAALERSREPVSSTDRSAGRRRLGEGEVVRPEPRLSIVKSDATFHVVRALRLDLNLQVRLVLVVAVGGKNESRACLAILRYVLVAPGSRGSGSRHMPDLLRPRLRDMRSARRAPKQGGGPQQNYIFMLLGRRCVDHLRCL